jgi:hypothetical protein
MVIFRCDMLILLGPLALVMLFSREVTQPSSTHSLHCHSHTDKLLVNSSNWNPCLYHRIAGHCHDRLIFLEKVIPLPLPREVSLCLGCCGLRAWSSISMGLRISQVSGASRHGIGTSPPPYLGFDSFLHQLVFTFIPQAMQLSLPFSVIGITGLTSHFLFKENSSFFCLLSSPSLSLLTCSSSTAPLSHSVRYYLTPYLLFVILYSILPHKVS